MLMALEGHVFLHRAGAKYVVYVHHTQETLALDVGPNDDVELNFDARGHCFAVHDDGRTEWLQPKLVWSAHTLGGKIQFFKNRITDEQVDVDIFWGKHTHCVR